MVHERECLALEREPSTHEVRGQVEGEDLEGDLSLDGLGLTSAVDHAHAPSPQLADDPIGTDSPMPLRHAAEKA